MLHYSVGDGYCVYVKTPEGEVVLNLGAMREAVKFKYSCYLVAFTGQVIVSLGVTFLDIYFLGGRGGSVHVRLVFFSFVYVVVRGSEIAIMLVVDVWGGLSVASGKQ